MKLNIIGAGRLGRSIAYALTTNRLANLEAVLTTTIQGSERICNELQAGTAIDSLKFLPFADLTFITTPDDCIDTIVDRLVNDPVLHPGSIVVHCSGVLGSDILKPLRQQGCYIASFHPLKAFQTQTLNSEVFKHCDCVMEGDPEAIAILSNLFEALDANLIAIKPESKIKYHAAAVIASNYLVTLSSLATTLLEETGIPDTHAKSMITKLMESNLENIKKVNTPKEALTGPLSRGDLTTIKMHLDHLSAPHLTSFYRHAGLVTLPLTTLNEETKQSIETLLLESIDC